MRRLFAFSGLEKQIGATDDSDPVVLRTQLRHGDETWALSQSPTGKQKCCLQVGMGMTEGRGNKIDQPQRSNNKNYCLRNMLTMPAIRVARKSGIPYLMPNQKT